MINLQHIQNLGEGDTAFVRDLIDVFLQETPGLLNHLEKAAQMQDWKQAGLMIHQLKSNFALFGLEPLTQLSRQIEAGIKNQQSSQDLMTMVESLLQKTSAVYKPLETCRNDL